MVGAYRPRTLAEALAIRRDADVVVLAGGTDLCAQYRSWAGTPPAFPGDVLLVGHLPELAGIHVEAGRMVIGAATTFRAFLEDPAVPDFLKPPVTSVGSPAVRHLATFGGNICHASPAGDTLPMLYALDAVLALGSTRGTRDCPIRDFIEGPGRTTLAPDEILLSISFPTTGWTRASFRKVGQRKANAIAKVSFFGIAGIGADGPRAVRMALGAVGPVVVRSPEAEEAFLAALPGNPAAGIAEALDQLSRRTRPIDDLRSTREYRRHVALRLAERFLEEVIRP